MEEPGVLIRGVIFFFAGGDAGIFGAIGIATIALLGLRSGGLPAVRRSFIVIAIVVSVLLIVCGSPIVPFWFQIATLLWLIAVSRYVAMRKVDVGTESERKKSNVQHLLSLASFAWLFTILLFELPIHFRALPADHVSQVLVIGDSVTAGLNDGEDTWPIQLSRAVAISVVDASQPGATLRSARKQNELLDGRSGHIVLEIGGNDMLEGLPVARFESELDSLLSEVTQPDRTIMMFELPLPPFCTAYGAAQRRQAARHGVYLIPKRRFAQVLTTSGATVDGIHLSIRGQTSMMSLVSSFVCARSQSGSGNYQRLERTSNHQ